MAKGLYYIFALMFFFRISTLLFSIRNEKRLKREGGVEYGARNSVLLAILHVLFYFLSLGEGVIRQAAWNNVSAAGLVLYAFSAMALLYVIAQLRDVWTVKLILAKNHRLHEGIVFRLVKHPNYYLNIIPELIAVALVYHARTVFFALFPLYLVVLFVRIRQENQVMGERFPNYG